MPVNLGMRTSGTPLDFACQNAGWKGDSDAGIMSKYLIEELSADPTLRNRSGLKLADLALDKKMSEVHAYLRKVECVYKTMLVPPVGESVAVAALVAET